MSLKKSSYGILDYKQWQETFNSVANPNKAEFKVGETIKIKVYK